MEPSHCAKKLRMFLDNNGIRYTFAAKKLGISQPTLSGYLSGKRPLPKKSIDKIVIFTKGKITKNELLREYFRSVENDNLKGDGNNET